MKIQVLSRAGQIDTLLAEKETMLAQRQTVKAKQSALVKQAAAMTEAYMEPGAGRFINRQITAHLGATPEQFDTSKLAQLAKWVELSASLLIDKAKAKTLASQIRHLQ